MLTRVGEKEIPLPLLITGIAGVTGYNAFRYFYAKFPGQVIGIRPNVTWQLVGEGIEAQDVDDDRGMEELFRRYRFGSVLNTVGNCALKSCELDRSMAWRVNVLSAEVIAQNVVRHNSRLVHLSSDLVFSGTKGGFHKETDPVDPVSMYGKTMVMAERVIMSRVRNASVLRISLPMGPSFNRHAGAIDWIDSRFRANRPATLYYDEVRSPTYCDDMNHVFEWFLQREVAGLFHMGGPRFVSLFEIAQTLNKVAGYNAHLVKGCPRVMAGPIPPRAGNVSMNSEKLTNVMGYCPFRAWPYHDDLVPNHRRWHFERDDWHFASWDHVRDHLYRFSDWPVAKACFEGSRKIGY